MGRKKIRMISLKVLTRFRLVSFALSLVLVCLFFNAYTTLTLIETGRIIFRGQVSFAIFTVILILVTLLLMITLAFLLHRGFGALSRMESILDKIIEGDYSQRIYLRKGDIMIPFANKLNKLIDLLGKDK